MAASLKKAIKPQWYTKRWEFMLTEPTRTWQAVDIRQMTSDTNKNWLFPKSDPINTLVLDAHITFRHLNVRRYASEQVWEVAQIEQE